MATTSVPVPVPERQPSQEENNAPRRASWPREKKTTRFTIKLGGVIPC